MEKPTCCNCGGTKVVSVSMPCPVCVSAGLNEVLALRKLAIIVKINTENRVRPNKTIVALLREIDLARGIKTED